jgi:ABC-type arginine transport system ATPase subunit
MQLEVQGIDTYYGLSHILFDVSLEVDQEATAALRNQARV